MEFFKVSEPLSRRLKARFLSVDGLSKELFSGDLLRRRSLILDPRRAP
jgi:hypothetical protein